jgi:hypothetical protein
MRSPVRKVTGVAKMRAAKAGTSSSHESKRGGPGLSPIGVQQCDVTERLVTAIFAEKNGDLGVLCGVTIDNIDGVGYRSGIVV